MKEKVGQLGDRERTASHLLRPGREQQQVLRMRRIEQRQSDHRTKNEKVANRESKSLGTRRDTKDSCEMRQRQRNRGRRGGRVAAGGKFRCDNQSELGVSDAERSQNGGHRGSYWVACFREFVTTRLGKRQQRGRGGGDGSIQKEWVIERGRPGGSGA